MRHRGSNKMKRFGAATSIIALAAFGTITATAQEATDSDSSDEAERSRVLGTVTVTAEKKEANLQDTAVSVTAFSGEQLTALGFVNSTDVLVQTPGLEAGGFGGGAIQSYSIRGVGQNDFAPHQEAPIALYIDEVYQISNVSTRFTTFDIDRAEVLRGPQGTLFGRNSTGGLVHYITAKPTQDFGGFLDVTVGEEGRLRFEGAVGGGLSDNVAFRLSAIDYQTDGLIEQATVPNTRRDDFSAVRAQLLLDPTENLSVLLKAQYGTEDGSPGGYNFSLPAGSATDFFGYADADGDPFTAEDDFASFKTNDTWDFTGTVNWDLSDSLSLTSVTNFQNIEDSYAEDADVSPTSLFNYGQNSDIEQFSQELRLNIEGDNHSSVFGVYYLDADGTFVVEESGDVFFGPGAVFSIFSTLDTQAWAVFGQTEFDISERASLVLGGRFNSDEKDFTLESADFGFPAFADTLKEEEFSWKAQLNFDATEDVLLYAGVSRGIKSGGFNIPLTPVTTDELQFDGEKLTSYEAGIKATIGNYSRVNAAVFYYDYEDYQAYNIDPFFNTLLFNAEAELNGAEIEWVSSPVDGLDLLLGASYIDAEVTDIPTALAPSGTERPALTPELTFNGLVRYGVPAFGGEVAGQIDFNWKDDHKFNLITSPSVLEDSYGVLNARVSYTSGNDAWTAAVFVKNLTDEDYRTFGVDGTGFFGSNEDVRGEQQWFGANLRINF